MARRKPPVISDTLLDPLQAGADPKSAFDPNGLLDSLKKALAERARNAEMDRHLSGEDGAGNGRTGYSRKTVLPDTSKIELDIPRDRRASFDPQLRSRAGITASGLRARFDGVVPLGMEAVALDVVSAG